MDLFLYDNDLRHERIKQFILPVGIFSVNLWTEKLWA